MNSSSYLLNEQSEFQALSLKIALARQVSAGRYRNF